jgi:hypothetical protein
MPFGISVVRHAAVLCICNVRTHGQTTGDLALLKCFFLTYAPFSVSRALGESSADSSLIVEWEGPDALEPIENVPTEEPSLKTQTEPEEKPVTAEELESEAEPKQPPQRPSPAELSESSDDGSGDEYVDEGDSHKRKVRHRAPPTAWARRSHRTPCRKRANNRRVSSSDSEEDSEKGKAATGAHARRANVASSKTKVASTSAQQSGLKRKQSISGKGAASAPTLVKRKRAESSSTTASATEDVARKYCLGKFTEMFTGIFMQYPYIQQDVKAPEKEGEGEGKVPMVERKPEDLSEEEKTQIRERAMTFAAELEQAVFETYSEADKNGKAGAGVKYKYAFLGGTLTMFY